MKLKALTILSALLLFLATPALAQLADEPMQDQTTATDQAETAQPDHQEGVETSASAPERVRPPARFEQRWVR